MVNGINTGYTQTLNRTQLSDNHSSSVQSAGLLPPANATELPSIEIPSTNDTATRVLSGSHLEHFNHLPQMTRDLLMATPFIQQQKEPLDDKAFKQIMAAAGQLETYDGPKERLQLTADTLLGKTYSVGDLNLMSKALAHLEQQPFSADVKEKMGDALYALRKLDVNSDAKTYSSAYERLSELADAMPKDQAQTVSVRLLAEQVRSGGMEKLRDEFKQSLREQMQPLTKGGSERAASFSFNIGGALGLLGIKAGSATVGLKYDVKVTGNDDTRIRASHKGTLELGFSAGPEADDKSKLSVALKGSLGVGKTQAFSNLDGFIDYHANDMLVSLAGDGVNKLANIKGIRQVRQADAQMREVISHRPELAKQLIHQGLLSPGEKIQVIPKHAPTPIEAKSISLDGNVSIEATLAEFAGITTGAQSSITNTTFTKHANLLDVLMTEPGRIESRPDKFFSVSVPEPYMASNASEALGQRTTLAGNKGKQWIEKIQQELEFLAKKHAEDPLGQDASTGEMYMDQLAAKRNELKNVIVTLKQEYDAYLDVVNRYDAARQDKESHTLKSDLARVKHAFEGNRGAEGRGEYLRAVMCTHAKLNQAYMASFVNGDVPHLIPQEAPFNEYLTSVVDDYSTPQLNLEQKKHIDKNLTLTSGAQSTDKQASKSFSAKLDIPLVGKKEVGITVRYNKIEGHINPDNDGDYLNVAIKADIPAMTDRATAIKGLFKEGIGKYLSNNNLSYQEIAGLDELSVSGSLGISTQFEGNFVRGEDGKYHLQYVRATDSTSLGASGSVTAGVVTAGGGVSISGNDHLAEWIGDNTLSYLQTKYNGWQNGQQTQLWEQYTANHHSGLGNIFDRVNDHSSNLAKELDKRAQEIPNGNELKALLQEKAAQYHEAKTPEHFEQAMDALNAYFKSEYQAYKDESQERLYPKYNDR
ncbi:hypothetical protein [Photobacterium sp. J15]|uniref:hypothetical protein n=1 Tax=Photobacterium sp. J15 TaxID=265901 RepID=UPI0007E4A0DD|nr:hypothetical protein [Photobacterium sp. J15]